MDPKCLNWRSIDRRREKNEKGLFLSLQTCCVYMFFAWFKLWKFQQFEEMLLWIGTEFPLFKSKRCASELFTPVKSRVDWEFWFIDRNISFSLFLVDFRRNTFVSSYRGEIDIFWGNSDLLPESLTWNFHLLPIPGTFVTMVPWWTFVYKNYSNVSASPEMWNCHSEFTAANAGISLLIIYRPITEPAPKNFHWARQ